MSKYYKATCAVRAFPLLKLCMKCKNRCLLLSVEVRRLCFIFISAEKYCVYVLLGAYTPIANATVNIICITFLLLGIRTKCCRR